MAKITQGFSYTFKPGSDQWSKINLEYEIDTDLPIKEQLEAADVAANEMWEFLRNKVDVQVGEIYDAVKRAKEAKDDD